MKENVLGSVVLALWLGVLVTGLSLLRASLPRIGENPYALNQIIYYAIVPFLVCSIVAISLVHIHRVRRKPTGFDPAIYMALYIFLAIALVPYMLFYTGGI